MDVRLSPSGEVPADQAGIAGDFLQTPFWAEFKSGPAWKALSFELSFEGGRKAPLIVLVRRLPLGFSFAYVPHGPLLGAEGPAEGFGGLALDGELSETEALWSRDATATLAERLRSIAEAASASLPSRCLFIRFDLPQYRKLEAAPGKAQLPGLKKTLLDVQVPDSVILDLSHSEEEILAGMKPKWRYNVKLAGKKGVRVDCLRADAGAALDAGLSEFYKLYRVTSERDGIALHAESYYRRLFELSAKNGCKPDLRLYLAKDGETALAGIITLYGGEEAVYLYGASSNEKRELMPAYALQWEAIRQAKASGCLRYDFFGIPPTDDPSHPMHGLYRFKTGFGGAIIHRLGCWDYRLGGPLRFLAYSGYRFLEWARWFRHKKVSKFIASLGRRRGSGGKAEKAPQSPASENTSASNTKNSE